jgi:hypothetical protein
MALIQPMLSLEAEGSEVLKMVLEVVFSGQLRFIGMRS